MCRSRYLYTSVGGHHASLVLGLLTRHFADEATPLPFCREWSRSTPTFGAARPTARSVPRFGAEVGEGARDVVLTPDCRVFYHSRESRGDTAAARRLGPGGRLPAVCILILLKLRTALRTMTVAQIHTRSKGRAPRL